MGFSRQEYWNGLACPSPGDLPDPGIEPGSPALQADCLTSEPPGKPHTCIYVSLKVPIFVYTFIKHEWRLWRSPVRKILKQSRKTSQPQGQNHHLSFVTPKSTTSAHTKNDSMEDYDIGKHSNRVLRFKKKKKKHVIVFTVWSHTYIRWNQRSKRLEGKISKRT